MKSRVEYKGGMHFMGDLEGLKIPVDAKEEFGGQNKGPLPKGLVLTGLAGCTAMDVIGILKKMRIEPESFSVEAEAELANDHPKVFTKILITYTLKGTDIPFKKVEKAVKLSQDMYCGVSAMLKKATQIDHKIIIET
jgi:putative redox protein